MTANLPMGGFIIQNHGTPVASTDVATKGYVDTADSGKAANTITISAGTGLTGGGDLTANRTISVATGGIGSTQLAANAVLTTNITDGNVTQAKLANPATFATSVATTSGTTIDFTSIPSWVRRITVVLSGVSTNGTGSVCIRVGSGSFATSGYLYSSTSIIGAVNTTQSSALFFSWFNASETAAAVRHGAFRLYNPTGNQWVCDHTIALSNTGAVSVGAGNITLGGTLDRVQLLNSAGDTFDAGAVNIVYEV